MSATAQQIVERALRRLALVNADESPDSASLAHGLAALNELIASWAADGLATADRTLTAAISAGSATVTVDTAHLAAGMLVSGTGIPSGAVIASIDSANRITLSQAATVSNDAASLTFTAIPFGAEHEAGVIALLAARLAEDYGKTPGPVLLRDAERGEERLRAAFIPVLPATFDTALVRTSLRVPRGDT